MTQVTQQQESETKGDKLLAIVDAVNVLARVEAIVGFLLANRRRSKKHPKQKRPAGALELRVPRDFGGTGYDVQDVLTRHGIDVWGGRTNATHFVMYIKRRQAWGIGVLRGKGIPVESSVNVKAINVRHAWVDGPQEKPERQPARGRRKRQPGPDIGGTARRIMRKWL